ncbi:hypothetical protein JHS3_04350 [Jeongeupia sp. HS-3]|uniref:hypothetical protein n=1 Tax=Jeongeupia sp. HS-3 TaxID=1009682 RepID=UPI0018A624A7|nr:hypothetical protein [Jeongeupia sp. HS-3]BCL74699.1 hypothetical protein JHS3_04350 [Jeongeupia sp. HS-3]
MTMHARLPSPIAPSIKWRNILFDMLFYDVDKLTLEEQCDVLKLADHEGGVVVVSPGKGNRRVRAYANVDDCLKADKKAIQAIVVAGVGSSAIGTAALACNVADAYDIDVAGIVSGYGVKDVVSESLGGWFFYGASDALGQGFRALLDYWGKLPKLDASLESGRQMTASASPAVPLPEDVSALIRILQAAPPGLRLLVGHSKGCLLLDFALERFAQTHQKHAYFKNLRVATFGTVVNLPEKFERSYQFIGDLDWFGGVNSRLGMGHTKINQGWHHLNSKYLFHMDVESVLKRYVPIR